MKQKQSFWDNFLGVFDYNPTTLSGALDVIVSQDKDGKFKSSDFHFSVGKFKVFKPKEKVIDLYLNNKKSDFQMQFSSSGIAYFEYVQDEPENQDIEFSSEFLSEEEKINFDNEQIVEIEKKSIDSEKEKNLENNQKKNSLENSQKQKPKDDSFKIEDEQLPVFHNEENKIQLSYCAHLIEENMTNEEIKKIFDSNIVSFQKFDLNPHKILNNEKLMIRIGNKIYEPFIGIPQILSLLVYDQELTSFSLKKMASQEIQYNPKEEKPKTKMKKCLYPPQEFWTQQTLSEGINDLKFVFKGNLGNEYQFHSRIFYYPYKPFRRIIISDIDGTITKSDVLGHLMPFIYKDWSHEGIAKFFSDLYD